MMNLRLQRNENAAYRAFFGLSLIVGTVLFGYAGGAAAESLSVVEGLITKTVNQHPSVLVEKATQEATTIDIDVARKQRYPKLEVQSNLGTLSSSSASRGSTATLAVEQPLWTFGRLQAGIDGAMATDVAQVARIQEVRYDLASRVVDAWQELMLAQARMAELNVTLEKLNNYLNLMKRRVESKISPEIELVLIGARVAQNSDDLQQAKAARSVALAKLERLLGESRDAIPMADEVPLEALYDRVRAKIDMGLMGKLDESLAHHPSVLKAQNQTESLRQQLNAKKAAQYPEVYARAQTNVSVGSDNNTNNDMIFVGVRYLPGNGFATADVTKGAEARVVSQERAVEVAKRDISNAVGIDYENMSNAMARVETLERAKVTSQDVIASYERQFAAGRRTWQDVLNAVRENNDNRVAQANARATVLGSMYRIRIRMSDLDWQQQDALQLGK